MFKRSHASRDRAGKSTRSTKRSFGNHAKRSMLESLDARFRESMSNVAPGIPSPGTSAIVTLVVGLEQRLFAAHEDILCRLPYFQQALKAHFFSASGADNPKRIALADEEPETFSAILEYLYKGDYYPRMLHDKRRNAWYLEGSTTEKDGQRGIKTEATMFHAGVGAPILRDTAVYCAADRYGGLEELKKLALRKQGLQSGIEVSTILRSARYAYEHTPDSDSRLRAHYLALIIRSRKTFKRSGTMQMEMELGGKMFFDLFVAMCNHMDDLSAASATTGTPKTI